MLFRTFDKKLIVINKDDFHNNLDYYKEIANKVYNIILYQDQVELFKEKYNFTE